MAAGLTKDTKVQSTILLVTRRLTLITTLLILGGSSLRAQQPFVTDDADVTPRKHFHFEFSNEFDVLHRSSFPNVKQNTADVELDYGIFRNVEIGIEAPLLLIFNDAANVPRRSSGLGDTNLSLKYNFVTERQDSRKPAIAIALNLELPTGNTSKQLGSGLADFYVNGVLQKSVGHKMMLRLNGGILFSGNETTGVVGIKTRGTVFTGSSSLVRQFTRKLDLGFEVSGAVTKNLDLGKGQLQTLIGGNYAMHRNATLDFGVVAGKYAASPRLGLQVGLSVDW